MNKLFAILLFFIALPAVGFAEEPTKQLTIIVEDLKNNKGNLLVGIYNQAEGAFEAKAQYAGDIVPCRKGNMTFSYHLPVGEYAVGIIHDENKNNELDTNFLGIPTEGYGFSSSATRPDYDKAKFELTDDLTITIKLK